MFFGMAAALERDLAELKKPPVLRIEPFDWLKEYGPHWTPETKAFWLDPESPKQVQSWFAKYRPDFTGQVECAGMVVTISPPVLQNTQNVAGLYAYQQLNALQYSANIYNRYSPNQHGLMHPQSIFGNLFGNLI